MNIETDDKCRIEFENLKFRKTNIRYIVFNIVKERIVVERLGPKEENWETFMASLPSKEYRFAVFDFEFKNSDNMEISKVIFVSWSPDETPIKARMLYATAKEAFKKYLDLNSKDFTPCSKADITQQDVIKQLSK